jgi:hypothetical protein
MTTICHLLQARTFRVKAKIRSWLKKKKQKIQRRLAQRRRGENGRPVLKAKNIRYEVSQRQQGIAYGGIGAIHLLAQRLGLVETVDRRLKLLKIHQPYHESDHVLAIAYNLLCGGACLEDLERLRQDEAFLAALEAERLPDPTTAGDFCRRFDDEAILQLEESFQEVRQRVWAQQPKEFFREAILDVDGTMVETTGSCKAGMDISYKGQWGYHPLLVSLANTGEPLLIVNRSGNRPSHEGAWAAIDDCVDWCRQAGFEAIALRGDTDFTQTAYLDGWAADPKLRFYFGIDAMPNLVDLADKLPASRWQRLERRVKRPPPPKPRRRPENVKTQIVRERQFENLCLECEEVAEVDYQPTSCRRCYRLIVVKKTIAATKGQLRLLDEVRYFFYLTNDRVRTAAEVVFFSNDRCNQENLIQQLKHGVRALKAPMDNLTSNWAYMVMASLAWSLKAWLALSLPQAKGRWAERRHDEKQTVVTMDFATFVQGFVHLPAQIIRQARHISYRLLAWNPWLPVFFRLPFVLRC